MGFVSRIFKNKAKEKTTSLISEITDMGDKWFTSDEERKALQVKLEELAALNPHPFVAGGRAALLWGLALVVFYQLAGREILIMCLGITNPPAPLIDIQQFITHIFKLLAGAL
ncbi:hypothetical protein [Photobacterium leiognathi]|uniref:hypothetical protein n=1 Tax=Photobacterium leiognathi TaxID=553611 RepID=UPI0029822685|nr:hypothetical protein [Photobacterium leiognathi]